MNRINRLSAFLLGLLAGAGAYAVYRQQQDAEELELLREVGGDLYESDAFWDGEDPLPDGCRVHVLKVGGRSPEEVSKELGELVKKDLRTLTRRNVPFNPTSGGLK